jgi:hypothetical protein
MAFKRLGAQFGNQTTTSLQPGFRQRGWWSERAAAAKRPPPNYHAEGGDMSEKIKARILERGWTFEHVLSVLDHCKRSREHGAGPGHTRWWLGHQLEGYARGLHGLKHNSYAHVSAVSVPLNSVPVWSVAARRATSPKDIMIEHGTPKSEFVKLVYDVYLAGKLSKEMLDSMIENLWKIAVITREEDAHLSGAGLRSKRLESPEARWAAVGIQFAEQQARPAQ